MTTTTMDDKRAPRSWHLERFNAIKNVEHHPSSFELTAAASRLAASNALLRSIVAAAPPRRRRSRPPAVAVAAASAAPPPSPPPPHSQLRRASGSAAASTARSTSSTPPSASPDPTTSPSPTPSGPPPGPTPTYPPTPLPLLPPHLPPSPPPIPDEDARVRVSIVGSGADPDGDENGEIRANLPPPAERRSRSTEVDEEVAEDEDDPGDLSVQKDEAKGKGLGVTARDLAESTSNYESVVSSGAENSPSKADESSSSRTEGAISVSPNGTFKTFKRVIRSWTKGEHLGSGSFGTVYKAISDDGFFFAVKEVSLLDQGNDAEQRISQLEQEIMLLSRFQHENIVQYLGTEKAETTLYVFLQLVSQGSLASLYAKYRLENSQVSAYTRQILDGLNYLHQRNVVHRDIKCANILVNSNGTVKLADFGVAKETTTLNGLNSCKGSVYWMAPEVTKAKAAAKPYGPSADIWSLGCTVLEMLTRQHPYPNTEWVQAFFKIVRGELPPIPASLTGEARDFIEKCVRVDPSQRPTAAQLLEHPFVKRPAPSPSGSDLSL